MAAVRETVLYYNSEKGDKVRLLKGVLVRMGVRIKNIAPDQVCQQVGYLAGLEGFEKREIPKELPVIPEELLVLHNFTDRRLDELLRQMKKGKVLPISLKAVVTESNANWDFYRLYREIRLEHEQMSQNKKGGAEK